MGVPGEVEPPDAQALQRRRQRRLLIVLGTLAAAAVIAVVLIATSSSSDPGGKVPKDGRPLPGATAVTARLAGIPQAGIVLGDPQAKVTLVEFLDPQCPFCKAFSDDVFPTLVRDYVRTGKVRYEVRTLTFLGQDSVTGARFLTAAGLQHRQFNAQDLLYRNQGAENSGYMTPAFLRAIGRSIPGFDTAKALADMDGPRVAAQLGAAKTHANVLGVSATPTVAVGPTGGTLKTVDAGDVTDPGPYTAALDAALQGR